MARIFITGSSDGLGLLASKALVAQGHRVVMHARNDSRASHALQQVPGAESVITGDLSQMDETRSVAEKANASGKFDAVIHNAGVYQAPAKDVLAVNVLAPYILTCLMQKPQRLIYLSSDMHLSGHFDPKAFNVNNPSLSYSDSKLHVLLLCKAAARKWSDVYANAVNPGWVPTKMGGRGAPDDLTKGYETQVWLATSNDDKARVSGRYFFHQKESRSHLEANNEDHQEKLFLICEHLTGLKFPSV